MPGYLGSRDDQVVTVLDTDLISTVERMRRFRIESVVPVDQWVDEFNRAWYKPTPTLKSLSNSSHFACSALGCRELATRRYVHKLSEGCSDWDVRIGSFYYLILNVVDVQVWVERWKSHLLDSFRPEDLEPTVWVPRDETVRYVCDIHAFDSKEMELTEELPTAELIRSIKGERVSRYKRKPVL